tara:strand:+ start:73 stop:480 length:408 start_codon:yes stop_codon:yes gene_type:complete
MKNFLEKLFKNPIIIVIVFLLFLVPITLSQSNEKLTGILKVKPNASLKDIQKEYRRLAMKFHPDKSGSEEEKKIAEKKMSALNNDYEILSKRAKNKEPLFNDEESKSESKITIGMFLVLFFIVNVLFTKLNEQFL